MKVSHIENSTDGQANDDDFVPPLKESQVALRYIVKMCPASKFESNVRKRKAETAAAATGKTTQGVDCGPTPAKRRMKMRAIP